MCYTETMNSQHAIKTIKETVMKTIATKNAPAAIGPYSQAYTANGFLFTSGHAESILACL